MYLIPANSKRGKLIFNVFRPVDLVIFAVGIGLTLILLLVIKTDNLVTVVIKLFPALLSALLVMPVPNYHNVLMFIQDLISFFSNRRIYVWKGWCVLDESEN